MRKDNASREQLIRSVDRRLRHLMVQSLENFEHRFQDIEDTGDGQKYKAFLRTAINDVIRATRDELYEYDVEYRPLSVSDDNILSVTRTFLETVQKMEFSFLNDDIPSFKIYSGKDKIRVMTAIRSEFGQGVIYEEEDSLVLEIVGIEACANSVIFILDRYRLHTNIREQYREWRCKVVKAYRS
jgi:hypothetical protein